jgi:hypothetical protein
MSPRQFPPDERGRERDSERADHHWQRDESRPARNYRDLHSSSRSRGQSYDNAPRESDAQNRYSKKRFNSVRLDREDIIQSRGSGQNLEYWDSPTIDYDAGEYMPDDYYGSRLPPEPGHVHQPGLEPEHHYSHERWSRGRYGMGSGLPEYWADRDGNYDSSIEAQYPQESYDDINSEYNPYYYSDEYYVGAPDFYRDRYMPREDNLKRIYLRMFRNIEYNIKVPLMQLIATGALFFIFIINYMLNYEYVEALGNFSPWVGVQPPAVAAILAAVFGIFLYMFPNMDRDIKRTVIIVTILMLIVLFTAPGLIAWGTSGSINEVGKAFATSIFEFLKLTAVLVYWSPMFLGIYGIWTRNSFYIGASAIFLFLIIIVLDIYLFYEGIVITKIRDNWMQYVIFAVILFLYMELSDSAITFANYTSIKDKEAIDPGYYEHLDKILEKYFVYFILFTVFVFILAYISLNFNIILKAIGSEQVADSIELGFVFGNIMALIIISLIIIFIGLFIRHERGLKKFLKRANDAILGPKVITKRNKQYYRRSRTYNR